MAGEHDLPHAPAEAEDFQHGVTDQVQVCHAGIVVKLCKQMGVWEFSQQKSVLCTFMACSQTFNAINVQHLNSLW